MKIVIALGGNALIKPGDKGTIEDQEKNIRASVGLTETVLRQAQDL